MVTMNGRQQKIVLSKKKLAVHQNPWEVIWQGYKCGELV